MVTSPDVLIIGAGPAGLTAAAEAIRHGLSVRVIDQKESRSSFSKALVLHSRSLEIFQDMGFVHQVLNSGRKFHALNIYALNKRLARIVFEELDWQDALFPYWLIIPLSDLTWSSKFSSKHFVVSRHRQGRVFLAGDAAHIHSPVGGQGLNSGIQDAYNLMWKLALVQYGHAMPRLLDSCGVERHKTAQNLITNVGRATKIVTLKNPLAQKLRNQLAGIVLNTDIVRNWMGRGVAMLDIAYRDSPASDDDRVSKSVVDRGIDRFKKWFHEIDFCEGPSAGMRAPNVMLPSENERSQVSLFDFYRGTHYTLMIFSGITGSPAIETPLEISIAIQAKYRASIRPYILVAKPSPELPDNKQIIIDEDQSIHRQYGAWEPCIYLIRPDQYIAYRNQTIDQNQLTRYLDRLLVRNLVN